MSFTRFGISSVLTLREMLCVCSLLHLRVTLLTGTGDYVVKHIHHFYAYGGTLWIYIQGLLLFPLMTFESARPIIALMMTSSHTGSIGLCRDSLLVVVDGAIKVLDGAVVANPETGAHVLQHGDVV